MHQSHLSTAQTAEELNQVLGRTSITTKTVQALIETGLFHDRGTGRSKRIDLQEVQDLVQRVRPVEPSDWPSPFSIFRVSLLGLHSDPVVTHHGTVLRQYAGVDYSGRAPISPRDRELAWTGVWAGNAWDIAARARAAGNRVHNTNQGGSQLAYVDQTNDSYVRSAATVTASAGSPFPYSSRIASYTAWCAGR